MLPAPLDDPAPPRANAPHRGLAGHKPIDAIQRVLGLLERFPSNAQMLVELPSK